MIRTVQLENFLGWQKCSADLTNITLCCGKGISAPFAPLRLLALLRQSFSAHRGNGALQLDGEYIQMPDISSLLVDPSRPLIVELSLTQDPLTPSDWRPGLPTTRNTLQLFRAHITPNNILSSAEYSGVCEDKAFLLKIDAKSDNAYHVELKCDNKTCFQNAITVDCPLRCFNIPLINGDFESKVTRVIRYELLASLRKFTYIGAVRASGDQYDIDAFPRWDVGGSGQYTQSVIKLYTSINKFVQFDLDRSASFSSVLSHYAGMLQLASGYTIQKQDQKEQIVWHPLLFKTARQPAPNDQDFNMVLPIITLLAAAPAYSLIAIERPEAGLSLSAQANLADAIADAAVMRCLHFLIETASSEFVARLRALDSSLLQHYQAGIYYFSMDKGQVIPVPLSPSPAAVPPTKSQSNVANAYMNIY